MINSAKSIDWKTESERFDQAADIYDKYRPSYPDRLIHQIIESSGIQIGDTILEIGAGSGKATELFVEKGFHLTCIEPGENLANIGMNRFKESGQVQYVVTRLEDWDENESFFDLAISAQAFHWVPKPEGYTKLAQLLKSKSKIALFWNFYIKDESESLKALSDLCKAYNVLIMEDRIGVEKRIENTINEILESQCFSETEVFEYPWEMADTADDFINFLCTSNGYISLDNQQRTDLNKKINLIFDQSGGTITRKFNCVLFLAQKSERCEV